MKLESKYIKCFSNEKAESLKYVGYKFLYEQNGVYYFENNPQLTVKFSTSDLLNDTKPSLTVNF